MKIIHFLYLLKYFNMKTVRTIQNIFSFNLNAKLLVTYSGDILNLEEKIQFHLDNSRFINYLTEDLKIILNNRNLGFFIDSDGIRQFDNQLRVIGNTDKYLLLYDRQNDKKSVYSVFDKAIILDSYEEVGSFINGNFLVTDFNSVIKLTDVSSKNVLLNSTLSTLGTWLDGAIEKPFQVAEFSGIYEKTLVCNLNSGAVLLLDIENAQNYTLLPEARFPRKMFPKKGEPSIYKGLMGRRYIEIDIISKKLVKEVSIEQQLRNIKKIPDEQTCWFSIGFSVLYDELYYFICETNFIGVFDPNEGKIIDYHEFEFDKKQYQQLKGGEENLQVKDGNIYCLDTLGNLFELER
jgi:hypothetical protein